MIAVRSIKVDESSGVFAEGGDAALDQAMLRAYSIERSLDYGCSFEDTLKLRRRIEHGEGWASTLSSLAADDRSRAAYAQDAGAVMTAGSYKLHAAAAWRLMQAGLEHRPDERLTAYESQCDDFASAMALTAVGISARYIDTSFNGASHGAWHFSVGNAASTAPCVLVWGGADGWREAFFGSVQAFLERGLEVCLLELPGQGLARLKHHSFLDEAFPTFVSKVIDSLCAGRPTGRRFGIVGHSLGGSLALSAAAADPRIAACCTNGGSVDLHVGLQKYPRVLRRFASMLGPDVANDQALALLARLELAASASRMHAELLCLHGSQDALVTQDEVNRLVDLRGPASTTVEVWPHGVHCLYNHAIERNSVLADWFASILNACHSSETSRRHS